MVRFGKKAALLAMAGVLTAASVTGCSGAIDAEATVVTVGKEKVPLGVVNFYARMMQGQYETYYAGMMGTTAEELWTQDAGDDKTYEESERQRDGSSGKHVPHLTAFRRIRSRSNGR